MSGSFSYLPQALPAITPLIAFGLLLIVGCLGGYLAHRISWLPSITGFMAVGFFFGPSGLGLLSQDTIVAARIFVDVALALILYRLGLSLDLKLVRRSPSLLLISLVESLATFGLVLYVLYLFGTPTPIAALLAAIAISSSPAVLLHVAHEVGAKGPVTESTKTLVALNNVISFVVFSATLPALHYSVGAGWTTIVFEPLFRLLGSLLLGAIIALGLHAMALKTRQASQYKLALVIGAVMIGIGLADQLKLSMLFVPLAVGVLVKSQEREDIVSDLAFGPAFEIFFIVLFVFAGAGLHLHELVEFAPMVFAIVVVRSVTKLLAVQGVSWFLHTPWRIGASGGLLLIPMAGLAIGLVQTSGALFPQYASTITAVILGAVTVFESIGPPIATYAFRLSGEASASRLESDQIG